MDLQQEKSKAFQTIAQDYDKINNWISMGMHTRWKKLLIKRIFHGLLTSQKVLDIACGTGDNFQIIQDLRGEIDTLTGVDPSTEMITQAAQKVPKATYLNQSFEDISCSDNSFDIITCTFGPRNMDDLETAIQKMHHVLRPGGLVGMIESFPVKEGLFTLPTNVYWKLVVPFWGKVFGHSEAYQYLSHSTQNFVTPHQLEELFINHGFTPIERKTLAPGEQVAMMILKKTSA
jgi:demethylmenaquinone methyltransferase/2-methoxy-6-polyprenyl-1,4-benzoquinol methylase